MASTKKTEAVGPRTDEELSTAQADEKKNVVEYQEVLDEFYKTHHIRQGYAYNPSWPEKIRKVE